jgi:excisionase family DNA binding protein
MVINEKSVSVSDAAAIIGITRSTVNNWINSKKLYAKRTGRNYSVPVKDLVLFLKSTGSKIPSELENEDLSPVFKAHRHCWDYWKDSGHGDGCDNCVITEHKIEICFTAKDSSKLHCSTKCSECDYYKDIYLPRIQFINQINYPAAVSKGLFIWGVNSRWSKIYKAPQKDFPGTGVEGIIDQDSLGLIISCIKKLELGEPIQPTNQVFLKTDSEGKLPAIISIYSLNEPSGTFLMLANPQNTK